MLPFHQHDSEQHYRLCIHACNIAVGQKNRRKCIVRRSLYQISMSFLMSGYLSRYFK